MKKIYLVLSICTLALFVGFLNNCSNKKVTSSQSEFTEIISGYSAGLLSNSSSIKVRLMEPIDNAFQEQLSNEKLFSFEPNLSGSINWIDNYTVEFIPSDFLPSGTEFNVNFSVSKILPEKNIPDFSFTFQTLKQAIFQNLIGIQQANSNDYSILKYLGEIQTADNADFDNIEKIISAFQDGNQLDVIWETTESPKTYQFIIEGIKRSESASEVSINWDGNIINANEKGSEIIQIPALGDFKLIKSTVKNSPNQKLSLHFSDPIKPNQNLNGLIYYKDIDSRLTFSIEGNDINVFSNQVLLGDQTIVVNKSIKNSLNKPLKDNQEISIHFDNIKPAVELLGNGVILPSTNGLIFPFKAVNLRAVNLKVIKVYEDNIGQFFQNNQFNGYSDLNRVGNIVFKKEIDLVADKPINYSNWNTFSLDLSELITVEKGAIYRVVLSFNRAQSLYDCPDSDETISENKPEYTIQESDMRMFEGPNHYYNDYDYNYWDYDWYERENPCKDSYYKLRDRIIATNVLASDMGIIAKSADSRFINAYVTNLKTTDPISGAKIDVFDFQNQLIGSANSDENGMVKIPIAKKPFLLIASKENEKGYLKLDDGNSLSLSMFDVSGQQLNKGIKGFMYGERGVWRPGDSLYLSFILEDKEAVLPSDQPVVFELFNPDNQLYKRKVRTHSVNGFYDFRTNTEISDPTGNWRVQVKVGGATFSKILKIETVKPNRLKIKLDFNKQDIIYSDSEQKGDISVTWLHGAVAKQLQTDVEMSLVSGKTSFEDYFGYHFDDPSKNFYARDEMIYDGSTDDKGQASFEPNINVKETAPGMLKVNFKTRVFEKGGDFSVTNQRLKYSPFNGYVGVKVPEGKGWNGAIFSNENNIVPIVTVDSKGNPVSRKNLKIEVFDIRWRWWWERDDYDDLSRYVSNNSSSLLLSEKINTINGKANFNLNFGKNLYGRKFIRVTDPISGHSTGQIFYVTYSGWWNRSGGDNSEGAEMLTFSLDKKSYNVNETIKVDLPEFKTGRALVSIESATGVLSSFWVTSEDAKSGVQIEATKDMAPNVFVHISLIQPHDNKDNNLPIRLYGVQGIKVVDPKTELHPTIQMPKEIAPESNFTVAVGEKDGKEMTYTIAVVDEGLLDLTGFATPDPWTYFYTKEALGVKTWDMYKYVINAQTGEMAGLLALGGGDGEKEEEGSKIKRFKPVVRYLGPFNLESGETNSHEIHMSNYVGSVRTMVIAGNKGSYGSTEETTPVKKPLMVLATLPRLVSPSEKVQMPVTVFAMDEKVKNVSVSIQANEMFTVNGPKTQNIRFDEVGDQLVNFELDVVEKVGDGKVKVLVKSGKHVASHEIEIEVRTPNPRVNEFTNVIIESGKSWDHQYNAIGIYGTNNASLEVSSIPPLNLDDRLKYLIRYPHGCIEQTTSSVFPQLHLSDLMDLDNKKVLEIENNIKSGINRLKKFQLSDGGMSYWPDSYGGSSEWGTNYAGHFLLEAKASGYAVPDGLINRLLKYQKQHANTWHKGNNGGYRNSELVQAYRLYTLALGGKPALGAMNRMKEIDNLSITAKWRLAGAYAIIGKKEIAKSIIESLNTTVPTYKEMYHSYGSSVRDEAMILEVLTLLDSKIKAKKSFDRISKNMASEQWYSTQTTAYSLLAISKFIGNNEFKSLNYQLVENGKSTIVKSENPIHTVDLKFISNKGDLKIINQTQNQLFVKVKVDGIPLEGDITEEQNNLIMNVKYLDMEENPIKPYVLDQGSDFIVEVEVKNPTHRSYHNLALSQLFPSGWEIRNTRMDVNASQLLRDRPTYQDFRDDRVYSYFNLNRGETKRYRIILNASYLGEYYLPITHCEAMYDNEIFSRKAGGKVRVVKAGQDISGL